MAAKPILILCPQYQVLVRGDYDCDGGGQYLLGSDGQFSLARTRCDQYGHRCAQTLCALHRFNRGGPGTWHPERILADLGSRGKSRVTAWGPQPSHAPPVSPR